MTKYRSSRPFHANFPFWVAVIRGFTRKFAYFRQLMLSCAQSPLIGINFAYLFSKTLVKWYELRIQLTNQGHFSKLLKRDFEESLGTCATSLPRRFIRLYLGLRIEEVLSFDSKFRLASYAEIGGYVNDTK